MSASQKSESKREIPIFLVDIILKALLTLFMSDFWCKLASLLNIAAYATVLH